MCSSDLADLARATGLTRVTVSDLVGGLIADGLLGELGAPPESKVGKPPTLVGLLADAAHIVALDLSPADRMAGAIVNLSGQVKARIEVPLGGNRAAPGETVFASVRRDRIAVRRLATGEARRDLLNSVTGEIHAIENQGSYVKVTIDLSDGEEFVANVLDEDYFVDPIDIGEPAMATWSAGDVRLLEDGRSARSTAVMEPSAVAA